MDRIGSPALGGDQGEDDGMGMEQMQFEQDAFSSIVDSAERRDKVASTLYDPKRSASKPPQVPRNKDFKKKSKSVVAGSGNFLRVRRDSASQKPRESVSYLERLSVQSNALDNPSEQFDYFYKIIVIGDEVTGKTNFLLRCAKGYYDPKPKTTYGVEFLFKNVPLPSSNQTVKA